MCGCDRVPRHDAQALGAFACVRGPVGEARSSVGRSGVTDWSGRPAHALAHAAHCLGHWVQTDEVQRAKEWQIRLESENHAVSRQAEAQVLTSPSAFNPLTLPGMPVLALCRRRASCALRPASSPPRPTRTHARTHARTRCGCSRRSARSSSCSRRQCGRHGRRRSLPTCVRATASADGVPQRYTRWCQHAARRVAQDVEAAALRERRLQEQLDESHDVRRSRTAARPAAQRGGLGGSLAAAHARARRAPPPSSSAHTRMRCAAMTALGGWAGDPVAARVQSDGRALAAPVPAGARSLDSVLSRYPGGTSGALGVPPGAAAQRATLHPAAVGRAVRHMQEIDALRNAERRCAPAHIGAAQRLGSCRPHRRRDRARPRPHRRRDWALAAHIGARTC